MKEKALNCVRVLGDLVEDEAGAVTARDGSSEQSW
jgi:hypothetical protein